MVWLDLYYDFRGLRQTMGRGLKATLPIVGSIWGSPSLTAFKVSEPTHLQLFVSKLRKSAHSMRTHQDGAHYVLEE